ncbi:hypothetical protein CAPTEDRAFT_198440 [Capitella teleta]|uniref:Retrotransposon gag domain-containing protein n=1 Tax=Capitella teleta TaxID=283909 RepID=R7U432_CAPTE|nr:hypothetical protein CAPTEDRAFT_198440 [Capitella teleta]|eukprot:ELT97920.1 hypothetical protein CAPTEDRAFT_198440 [Capitella teleta]
MARFEVAKAKAKMLVAKKVELRIADLFRSCGRGVARTEAIFKELRRWTEWQREEALMSLVRSDGSVAEGEEEVKEEVARVWGSVLNAEYGVAKETFEMVEGDKPVSMSELDRALQQLKCGKAMDDSGVMGEYVRGLGEREGQALREEFYVILRDGVVPGEWRSRVALLSKNDDRRVVLNYRPVAIINILCKTFMHVLKEMAEILRTVGVVMEKFGMEISEANSSVVRFNREPRQEKWKFGWTGIRWCKESPGGALLRRAKMAFVRKILWGGSMVAEVGRAALLEIGLQSRWWKEVERMALRFHWDELAHSIWKRRVSDTGREMCGVGEDWVRDMTKDKMNERVMEVGKEEWKRSLQSTELTRKFVLFDVDTHKVSGVIFRELKNVKWPKIKTLLANRYVNANFSEAQKEALDRIEQRPWEGLYNYITTFEMILNEAYQALPLDQTSLIRTFLSGLSDRDMAKVLLET